MKIAILGLQWGDEGKGKMVDCLAKGVNAVVRFQGGHNAGHTIVHAGRKSVFHLIPCGILHPSVRCMIGQGVVVSPHAIVKDFDEIESIGLDPRERLVISPHCPLLLECHQRIDQARENAQGKHIGTTQRGIGPAYEDKIARRGLRIGDIFRQETLPENLEALFAYHNFFLKNYYTKPEVDYKRCLDELLALRGWLRPLIGSVQSHLHELDKRKSTVLFEGAQGCLLDIDFGTYPYVTSSHTTITGVFLGSGIGPCPPMDKVLGMMKAYTTRVGNGPFTTEINAKEPVSQHLSQIGSEFGTTTNRPRRCGWLDLVKLKRAVKQNGVDSICLTKLDVLSGLPRLQICTHYLESNAKTTMPPLVLNEWEEADNPTPCYHTLNGWNEDLRNVQDFSHLPKAAQDYVRFIENYLEIKVSIISTGPQRDQNIFRSKTYRNLAGRPS